MANFVLARKLPSMDSYVVTDESGAVVLLAKHHLGLGKEHWDVTDAQGAKVGTITHEKLHVHSKFIINISGQPELVMVKVNWMPTAETWQISGSEGDLSLKGNLGDLEWTLTDAHGDVTASFQRKLVSLHNEYLISTAGQPMPAVALALALDAEELERDH